MTESTQQAPQIPPEVLQYLRGAPPESRQFDFLIGDWNVTATRYKPDGSVLMQYMATWNAKYLNEARMIMDDFKACAPNGQEISSYVTLRTYSEKNGRWEMAGLAALQPAITAEWYGEWTEGEMCLEAVGREPGGSIVRNKIRFFHIHENDFEWESSISRDGGKSWTIAASMRAVRASV